MASTLLRITGEFHDDEHEQDLSRFILAGEPQHRVKKCYGDFATTTKSANPLQFQHITFV